MWLAAATWSGRCHALTVDHGLRAESGAEAALVADLCARMHVPHALLRWEGRKPRAGRQGAARTARYRLMRDWCARTGVRWLLTGHHADDQAETVLMRLARGAGPAGLAGIRAVRPMGRGVTLARPLLATRKAALVSLCEREALPTVDDPSNRDAIHARTVARTLLAAADWLDPARLAASAAHLADAEVALAWATERAWAGNAAAPVADAHERTLDTDGLPRTIRLRLLARALAEVAPGRATPRGPDLARLLDALDRGEAGTLAGARAIPGSPWRFVAESVRGG